MTCLGKGKKYDVSHTKFLDTKKQIVPDSGCCRRQSKSAADGDGKSDTLRTSGIGGTVFGRSNGRSYRSGRYVVCLSRTS